MTAMVDFIYWGETSFFQGKLETRLTYNCAHHRSRKETLTIEYFRFIFKKNWVKICLGEKFLGENFLGEICLGENFWGEIFFG